jgi:hypothetical protein
MHEFRCRTQPVPENREIVEEGATRGTTAQVYLQLHISFYTGTVHALSRVAGIHPLV